MITRKQNLIAMSYDPSQPIDTVFNAIDQYTNLDDIQSIPITDSRKQQVAYMIFNALMLF